tara:strand:- start:1181 stop:1657 length:477 start_codon:yes stop_codon:yes gene_type:complete
MSKKIFLISVVTAITFLMFFLFFIIEPSTSGMYKSETSFFDDGRLAYKASVYVNNDSEDPNFSFTLKKIGFGYVFKYECDLKDSSNKKNMLILDCVPDSIDMKYYSEYEYLEWANKFDPYHKFKKHSFHCKAHLSPTITNDEILCSKAIFGCSKPISI